LLALLAIERREQILFGRRDGDAPERAGLLR
jgi:hypothetical protein